MAQVSNISKLRFALRVVEDLKQLNNNQLYFRNYSNDNKSLSYKIANKAGMTISQDCYEAGRVDLSEYIELTMDEYIHREQKRLDGRGVVRGMQGFGLPEFKVSEKLRQLTSQFEESNIPKSGPCQTEIGEMFRAIQRIQYRAANDGDSWYVIGSPSFMSYMYLVSKVDELNWSSASYNNETGIHSFEFTDEFLQQDSYDGKISDMIECSLAQDAEFIKFQLIDLLSNDKIKDSKNYIDSRSFTSIKDSRGGNW